MKKNDVNRRDFLKTVGMGSLAAIGSGMLSPDVLSAVNSMDPLKITKIEAIRFKQRSMTWVRLHTDQGIVGLGETYPKTNAQIGALKDLSRYIIGKDAKNIEGIWRFLYNRCSVNVTGGAEMRIISAVNIAQWDILGKALGVPIYTLLGGKAREKIKVYNTTIGIRTEEDALKYNDQYIEERCKFLYDHGVKGMKIWPYDLTALKNNESYISPAELEKNLSWIKTIRNTLGNEMEICIEFHCHWNLTSALRIAKSLEPYNIMWIEDILLPDNAKAYSILASETSIPVCASERLATRFQFRELLESKAVDIVMYDVTWCGGISEAKKISDFADTYYIPTAPHTLGGPILWYASMHVATALTNLWIMESAYRNYNPDNGRYYRYLKNVQAAIDGYVSPPEGPGLGIEVRPEIFENGEAIVETIAEI